MSDTRKKTPVRSITTADSEKEFKRQANRMRRRIVKQVLAETHDPKDLPHEKQHGNPWCGDKDGKARFDPRQDPKSLRK